MRFFKSLKSRIEPIMPPAINQNVAITPAMPGISKEVMKNCQFHHSSGRGEKIFHSTVSRSTMKNLEVNTIKWRWGESNPRPDRN